MSLPTTTTPDPGVVSEIERLTGNVRRRRDPSAERRLVRLRHQAAAERAAGAPAEVWPPWAEDRFAGLTGLPEVGVDGLDSGILSGAIVHHGCLVVRGLLGGGEAEGLRAGIDRAFEARRRRQEEGHVDDEGWFRPFRPGDDDREFPAYRRSWVQQAGGLLLADSPRLLFDVLEMFAAVGLLEVIGGHLGERPVLSVDKTTLRRVTPDKQPSWHQDGTFMGRDLRTVNTWVALTDCGGDASVPGLDVVPRRLDDLAPAGLPGARVAIEVADEEVARLAGDRGVLRPAFRAGDAVLFDQFFLHRTGVRPGMTGVRHALECWTFAPSTFPDDYFPLWC